METLIVGNLVIEGRHEPKFTEELFNELFIENTLDTKTLDERVTKDEHLAVLGGKRGLPRSLGLGFLDLSDLNENGISRRRHYGFTNRLNVSEKHKFQKKTFNFISYQNLGKLKVQDWVDI